MLERLYVDNYRCMVNFECRLAAKQLILGSNGAGKSTVFDVLALQRDFCVRGEPAGDALAGSTRTRWQNVPEQSFELDVTGNGGKYNVSARCGYVGQPCPAPGREGGSRLLR
jgi:AAA15 family ATPase/GTPase